MSTKINIAVAFSILTASCTKSDFLEKKPNTGIVVPSTITDMIQLLDNEDVMLLNAPCIGSISADEYYYPSITEFNASNTKTERNCYLWAKDIYQGESKIPDWNLPYQAIFYANVVLDQWDKLSASDRNSIEGRFVKGWALYERGYNFFNLVQIFSPAYDLESASVDLGIPIRLSSDINEIKQRASVKQTYDQILNDLTSSLDYFSNSFPSKNINRASKVAAFSLLARIYLNMRNYKLAGQYADSSLAIKSDLIDYNTLNTGDDRPFDLHNKEVIKLAIMSTNYSAVGLAGGVVIDTTLTALYETNDLRKPIFFQDNKGVLVSKSGYNGIGYYPFTGLAVDEMYLIKAECDARNGNLGSAINALNKLLINRYRSGTFVPFNSTSAAAVLSKVIIERRKELVLRGIRWSDIKRLNKEGANITLTRVLDGKTYLLPPNSPRYVMPIPDDEIALSHIQQSIR